MIGFNFDISNLFSDRFNCVYIKSGKTWFAHKFWELGIYENNTIISLNFSIKVKGDHPGFYFYCALFGWGIDFEFYDSRHNGHSSN